MSRTLLTICLSAFVAVALVDPGDRILHLKMPLFIAALAIWTARALSGRVKAGSWALWAGTMAFAVAIPGVASLIGMLSNRLPATGPDLATLKSFLILLLIPVVVSEGLHLEKALIRWSLSIAILTFVIVVVSIAAPLLFDAINEFAIAKQNALLSPQDPWGLGFGRFYYKTVAVLVFPLAYHFVNLLNGVRRFLSTVLTLTFAVAILLSTSRACILAALLVLSFFGLQRLKSRSGWYPVVASSFVVAVIAVVLLVKFSERADYSNRIKIAHFYSYLDEFDRHPGDLLWGEGADTVFYTSGFEEKTNLTELTYLELIREFGIPVTIIFLVALCYPFLLLLGKRVGSASYLSVPYMAYLLEAGTNPLLIGSTGLLVVVCVWGAALTCSQAEQPVPARVGAAG